MKNKIKLISGLILILLVDVFIHVVIYLLRGSELLSTYNGYFNVLVQLFMLGVGLLLYKLFTKEKIADMGFYRQDRQKIGKYFVIFLILGPIALFISYFLVYLFDSYTWSSLIHSTPYTFGGFIVKSLQTAVLPGICEETLYRGALIGLFFAVPWKQNQPISKKMMIVVIIISSVIFSFAHVNWNFQPFSITYDPYQLLTALLLGSFEAYVFVKTRNIWGSILIHNAYNFLSLVVFQLVMVLF